MCVCGVRERINAVESACARRASLHRVQYTEQYSVSAKVPNVHAKVQVLERTNSALVPKCQCARDRGAKRYM